MSSQQCFSRNPEIKYVDATLLAADMINGSVTDDNPSLSSKNVSANGPGEGSVYRSQIWIHLLPHEETCTPSTLNLSQQGESRSFTLEQMSCDGAGVASCGNVLPRAAELSHKSAGEHG